MKVVQGLLDAVAALGAMSGGLLLFTGFAAEASAPQQGAIASMALGLAVIPYCLASINHRSHVRRMMEQQSPTNYE